MIVLFLLLMANSLLVQIHVLPIGKDDESEKRFQVAEKKITEFIKSVWGDELAEATWKYAETVYYGSEKSNEVIKPSRGE